jgi:hypothetical protein
MLRRAATREVSAVGSHRVQSVEWLERIPPMDVSRLSRPPERLPLNHGSPMAKRYVVPLASIAHQHACSTSNPCCGYTETSFLSFWRASSTLREKPGSRVRFWRWPCSSSVMRVMNRHHYSLLTHIFGDCLECPSSLCSMVISFSRTR